MAAIAPKEGVKDAILDATDRLLARFGYRKMTVEDIAAEAGIGKGSIYLHFSSKEEVVLSHIDRIVDRLRERLKEIARSDATAAERLHLMLLTRVLFRFDSIQHYTQSLNDLLSVLRSSLLARRAIRDRARFQTGKPGAFDCPAARRPDRRAIPGPPATADDGAPLAHQAHHQVLFPCHDQQVLQVNVLDVPGLLHTEG